MKRKMFRKLMAASLATVMIVGMAGCGEAEENPTSGSESVSTPTSEVSTPSDTSNEPAPDEGEVSKYPILTDENGNVYDLGGMEIVMWSWYEEGIPNDEFGEAQTEWRDWIQETYNFKMSMQALGGWGDCPDSLVNYVTTGGDDNNYIFVSHSGPQMVNAMKQGLLYDVSTLDCVDFSDKKYQLNGQCNQYSKDGGIYAFMAGTPEPRGGVYFNKRLLEQTTGLKDTDLYELQKNNEWNWETFEDILKQVQAGGDIDNDGVQDIYPIGMNRGSFVTNAVYSNGGMFFGMVDGKYTYELENPKTLDGLQWAQDIMKNYMYPQPDGTEWNYFFPAFVEEAKLVFLPEDAYNMQSQGQIGPNIEDDFGFLMFPYGPGAGHYMNKYADNVFVLPGCYDADRAWKIMFAFDLWREDIPGFEDYNTQLAGYYDGARDLQTVEETIARMTSEGAVVSYDDFIPDIDMGEPFLWKFNGTEDVAANVEGVRTAWQSAVDKANGN